MKQMSKVIVVLALIVVAFVATTLGGLFGSDKRDKQAKEDLRTKGPSDRLRKVGKRLPSPMPSMDLVIRVDQASVTIEVPSCAEDDEDSPRRFRRADLSLESGPPVGVHVTDYDERYAQTPESVEDTREDKQKVRVIISDKGGTIVLKQSPEPEGGDIVLTREPQDDDESCVRFE